MVVSQQACPLLVPIVEAGEQNSKAAKLILENYLKALKTGNIDTLILGCTHYGILENKIRRITGSKIKLVSEGKVVAEKLKDYLKRHKEIEMRLGKSGIRQFYSTDLTDKFETLGSKFFGKEINARKPLIHEQLEKKKQEVAHEIEQQSLKTGKSLWERFKELLP